MKKRIIWATALCLAASFSSAYASEGVSSKIVQGISQNGRNISGIVVDVNGEPIIGASIKISGTSVGTITDIDGKFNLKNASGSLEISYIGYHTETVKINNRSSLKIILHEDSKELDEVIVVGYGTQKKASLTSAITQIKGDEVFASSGLSSPTVALQGEIPGLVVMRSSSRPGSEGAAIKIRGDVSINGDGAPTVIIDGMYGSLDDLNAMNANDIENISVLKDASAAIYGARSAAGVILITTKRGKKGKAQVSYSGSVSRTIDGIEQPLTNNYEWMDMFFEAQYWDASVSGSSLSMNSDPRLIYQNINWWIFQNGDNGGTSVDGMHRPILYRGENLFRTVRNGEKLILRNGEVGSGNEFYEYWDPDSYLENYLLGQATSQKHAINVRGGDDKFGYYASLSYSKDQSQLKIADDSQTKYGARINMDYQAFDFLKFETGMSYESQTISTPSQGVDNSMFTDQWFWSVFSQDGSLPTDVFDGKRNPIGRIMNGGQNTNTFTDLRGNIRAILDLSKWVKGLSFTGSGNYKLTRREFQAVSRPVDFYDYYGTRVMGSINKPGSISEQLQKWENITLGVFGNYENTFAGVHKISAMLGMTSEEEYWKSVKAGRNQGWMYPDSDLSDLNVAIGGDNNTADGGQSEWAFLSYLGRLNYTYDDKYSIELLGRRDGSSKLSLKNRWRNFYSISGYWRISREQFMESLSFLNDLKVRYNFGKTGNVNGLNNYERFATIKRGTAYFGLGDASQYTTMWVDGIRSDNRTWEIILSHNIGVDFALLNNRLSGSFDYFTKTNDNMFIGITYPAVLGARAPLSNNGKLRTKGWEVALNWDDRIEDFKYSIGASLSDSYTELLELANNELVPDPGNNNKRLIGKPLNAYYVYQTDGLFQTQEEVDAFYEMYYWNATHSGPKADNILPAPSELGTNRLRPGARRYVDRDGDGAITRYDLYYAGDAAPHLSFGLKGKFEWKGIDVSVFFQGIGSQNILRTGSVYAPFVTNYVRQNKNYLGKTWAPNHTDAEYPILSRDAGFNRFNYANVDASLQKSRYIRLKSLIVGYTIPRKWTSKAGINQLRVYFSGDDLWEWTSVKDGYDPERGEASNSTFPFSRLLTFGVDVTF